MSAKSVSHENYDDAYDSYDEVMKEPDRSEVIEKSLTNLNIGTARMRDQVEHLLSTFKEFCENFVVEQRLLREEIHQLMVEGRELKNKIDKKD